MRRMAPIILRFLSDGLGYSDVCGLSVAATALAARSKCVCEKEACGRSAVAGAGSGGFRLSESPAEIQGLLRVWI